MHDIRKDRMVNRYIYFFDMKTQLVISLILASVQYLSAQIPITEATNSMRNGDRLCKVKVDYVNPGNSGNDEIWSLGRIKKDSQDFVQTILSNRDTVAVYEQGRICHYLMHGDTLVYKGEQSRRSNVIYQQERPMLCYPFQYGDSLFGTFSSKGIEEGIHTSRNGCGYTVADGIGVLTDGEDTIRHITRIHFRDEYIDTYYTKDTITIKNICDRYSWYCAGCRYPIMESVHWASAEEYTQPQPFDSLTYLYLPIMQLELAEDAVNDSVLNELSIADAEKLVSQETQRSVLSAISASLSADGTQLNISYSLDEESSLEFCACDILGNILGHTLYENKSAGEWQECLALSRRPVGNSLMLNVRSEEKTISVKVYK